VRHFTIELEDLNHKLLEMARSVEASIDKAMHSLLDGKSELAEEVIRNEARINQMEMELDALTTRLIALRQPVARDLRHLTATLKITTDLERIGDLAMGIAKRSRSLTLNFNSPFFLDISGMASLVQFMLRNVMEAFVNGNCDMAHSVLLADAEIDARRDEIYSKLITRMQAEASLIPTAIDLILVARNLERIGDHTTNIAEDVLFMVRGVDVRHATIARPSGTAVEDEK
jgi:phosphate transport system protein